MDLGTNHIATLGRPVKTTAVEIVRELNDEDLKGLGRGLGTHAPMLKRITEAHHLVARLIAEGETGGNVAAATGYSQSRISILRNDPAFQELIAHYQEEVNEIRREAFIDTNAKLATLRNDSIDKLSDKLHDEDLQVRDILDIAAFASDRSGFGPQSKSQNVSLNIDVAEKLAVGRQRALELTAAIPAAKAAREVHLPLSGGRGIEDE